MIQLYQDEEGCVGDNLHAPLLPAAQPVNAPHPRWANNKSARRTRLRRLAIFSGAFLTIYLIFCSWVAYSRSEVYNSYSEPQEEDFPHGKLPWPFPKHPKHHPHPPPHPHPHPTVLGCTAVPSLSEDSSSASAELKVSIPGWKAIVLHDHLLHGDVSVTKGDGSSDETEMSEGKNLTVGITIANRTCPHPPPESVVEESEEEKFVLCAITFTPPHKHKHHPDEESLEVHPHPPHHRPPPPVIVTILPALNETYPKFPGPHHPPPGHPPHPPHDIPDEGEEFSEAVHVSKLSSVFSRVWNSSLTFLFPMLPILQDSFPKHWPHHPPFPHHGPPPPPPPFLVTSLKVSVSKPGPVKYGLPFFKPHGPRWRH